MKINYKLHFSLLLSIMFIFGCTSFENEPKPISSSETTVDIDIGEVIRSGGFEERVETEQMPQNNCDGKSSFAFSVSRERTLEQSVDLTLQGQGEGELEIAGKPMEVGAAGKIKAAIGAAYGQSGSKSISDSGGMEFTIEAGDFPIYTIVWREKWEKGYITVEGDGDTEQIPYLYQTTARPELVDVEYKDCVAGELLQKQSEETNSSEDVSISTNTPKPPTATPSSQPTSGEYCYGNCWQYDDNARTMTWTRPGDKTEDIWQPSGEALQKIRDGYTAIFKTSVPGEIIACVLTVNGEIVKNSCDGVLYQIPSGSYQVTSANNDAGGFRWCPENRQWDCK
ncbi:MAG: hypothetical protein GY797_06445 [Deltaproteobacteria bacterium]|nr:hypothetical protein [Deltaproteobacteria bacterium]